MELQRVGFAVPVSVVLDVKVKEVVEQVVPRPINVEFAQLSLTVCPNNKEVKIRKTKRKIVFLEQKDIEINLTKVVLFIVLEVWGY